MSQLCSDPHQAQSIKTLAASQHWRLRCPPPPPPTAPGMDSLRPANASFVLCAEFELLHVSVYMKLLPLFLYLAFSFLVRENRFERVE